MAKRNRPNVERVALRLPSEDLADCRRLCSAAESVAPNGKYLLSEFLRVSARSFVSSIRGLDECVAKFYSKKLDSESLEEIVSWVRATSILNLTRSTEPELSARAVLIAHGGKKARWRWVWVLSDGCRIRFGITNSWADPFEAALSVDLGRDIQRDPVVMLDALGDDELLHGFYAEYLFGSGYL